MENNTCPKCSKPMQYDIQLEYDHSPYYCLHCGYAEGCSSNFSIEDCNRCTEYAHCNKWHEIQNVSIARCRHCGKKCTEISEYIDMAALEGKDVQTWVKQNEGTFNRMNNTFICTPCYAKSLM